MRQNKTVESSVLPLAITPETALIYFDHKRFKAFFRSFEIASSVVAVSPVVATLPQVPLMKFLYICEENFLKNLKGFTSAVRPEGL